MVEGCEERDAVKVAATVAGSRAIEGRGTKPN